MSYKRVSLNHARKMVGLSALAVSVLGCHPNSARLDPFNKAASELPSAVAAAKDVSLAINTEQLDLVTPSAKNGAPMFEKALATFSYKDVHFLRSGVFSNNGKITARAGPVLAKYSPLLSQLRKAAAYPYCNFGPHGNYRDSDYLEDERLKMVHSCEILAIEAQYDAYLGDLKGCEADLATSVRIESHLLEDLAESGDMPAGLAESSIIGAIRRVIIQSQGDHKWAKALLGILNQTAPSLDYSEAVKCETAYDCQKVVAYLTMPPPAYDPDDTFKAISLATFRVPKKTSIDAFLARMLQLQTKLEQASKTPNATLLQISRLILQIQNEEDRGDVTHTFNIMTTDEEGQFQAVMYYQARRDSAITALTLILDHKPGSPWPATLPKDAPLDVCSEKPLEYKLTQKGFVVGPGGKDFLQFSYPEAVKH